MKRSFKYAFILLAGFVLTSCSGNSDKTEEEGAKKKCSYVYNPGTTVLEWTAYKFTEKAPVKGTFNKFEIKGLDSSEDPKELIESLTFDIVTESVETQNPERNGKIAEFFFGTIATSHITGKVKSLSQNGKATIEIKMNGKSQDVVGDYALDGGKFSFNGSIDVLNWGAEKGIEALNTKCKELHTGADGKSKLWSEIGLTFTTELLNDCE